MRKIQKNALVITRLAMGWLFFYAGITKVLDPEWTAAGFLNNAETFPSLYAWFATPANIGWVDFLNEWGLTLIGVALILGLFVRYASYAGILLMILYYFPGLTFPYAGAHSYIIDDHVVYILVFVLLMVFHAGRYWGLDAIFYKRKRQ